MRLVCLDLENRIQRAEPEDAGHKGNQAEEADPADAAGEEEDQAQNCNADDNADSAIEIAHILFHDNILLS